MLALAAMFGRWVEQGVSSEEKRARLQRMSSDYQLVAEHVGPDWVPTDLTTKIDAMQFAARLELGAGTALNNGTIEVPQ